MTVSFSTLLIVWMSPSCSAVRLEDDSYQLDPKGELDEFEDEVCPSADHPHLANILKRFGAIEAKHWENENRRARVTNAKEEYESTWQAMMVNDTFFQHTGERGLECHCCFKHPVVVKMGARLVQSMFPDMAHFIDDKLENITATLRTHPDHTVDHMVKNLNESQRTKSEALADQGTSWFPSPCQIDMAMIGIDFVSMIAPVRGLVNPNAAAAAAPAAASTCKGARKMVETITQYVKRVTGSPYFKSVTTLMTAKAIGDSITQLWAKMSLVFHKIVDDYKRHLNIFSAAVQAIKLMAQLAAWFLTGGAALVATLVAAIASLLMDAKKFYIDDKCLK